MMSQKKVSLSFKGSVESLPVGSSMSLKRDLSLSCIVAVVAETSAWQTGEDV